MTVTHCRIDRLYCRKVRALGTTSVGQPCSSRCADSDILSIQAVTWLVPIIQAVTFPGEGGPGCAPSPTLPVSSGRALKVCAHSCRLWEWFRMQRLGGGNKRNAGSKFWVWQCDSIDFRDSYKGCVISPTKMSPQGCTVFHQSVSHQLNIQLYTIYRTQLGYIH